MRVERFSDVARFYELVEPFLLEHEAENNFELGMANRLRAEPPVPEHLFVAVMEEDAVVASALMTPPWPMCVTRAPDSALDALADYVHDHQLGVNAVSGPVAAARRCAVRLAERSGQTVATKDIMRILQLRRVVPPRPMSGAMRVATMDDWDVVIEWMDAFGVEIEELHQIPRARTEQRVRGGEYYLWEDSEPVSIAASAGPTPNGIRINSVYTPPAFRGRGYASNCVAALTQRLLDGGKKFCFLYTDATNPTSNKIYEQIGYEFVCDWVNLSLT